ncbi:hypothetical protein DFJ73DRAFT_821484 [Zopfochytrium polystomum]|nr:hypothetical protein DFJ73DRAFT_821484 [Zopfochytrium polystomum]
MLGSPPQSTPTLHHGTSPSATVLPSVPSFPGNSSTSHCASAHPSRSSFVLFRLAAAVLLVLSALLAAYLAHTIICATAAFLGSSNEVRQLTRKDVHADSNVRDQFSPVMDNQPHNPEHERPISAQRFDFQAISTSRFGPLVDVLYINRDMSCAASPVAVLMFSTATLAAEGISCFLGQVRQNAQALLFRMPQRQSIEWRRTVVVLFALALRTRLPLPDPILESSVRLVSNVTLLLVRSPCL